MSLFDDLDGDAGAPRFDEARVPIPDLEFDKHQKLAFEKEMLGLYVSDHPLMGLEAALRRVTECTVGECREGTDGDIRVVGGVVTNLVRKYTRRGDAMATFVLEDLQSTIPVWLFPGKMPDYGWMLTEDAVVTVKGRLDLRDDEVKLVVIEVRRPELVVGGDAPLEVSVPLPTLSEVVVEELKSLLAAHPGPRPVILHLGTKRVRLADAFRVDASNGLHADLRRLLGVDCVVVA
jgi:DNA polymerase-3 subunit alpha